MTKGKDLSAVSPEGGSDILPQLAVGPDDCNSHAQKPEAAANFDWLFSSSALNTWML